MLRLQALEINVLRHWRMYFSCVWSSDLARRRRNRITRQLACEMTAGHRSKNRAAHRRYATLQNTQYKENGRILIIPLWQLAKFSMHSNGTYAICRPSNKLHEISDGCTLHLVWNKSQLPTWCKYLFILARHVSGYTPIFRSK